MLGSPVPVTVDEVGQAIVGIDNRDSAGRPVSKRAMLGADEFRRSLYVQVRRSLPLSMLETFDAPLLNPNCEIRNRSTVAPQSLMLMNSDFVLAQSQRLAERVIAACGDNRRSKFAIAFAWHCARSPATRSYKRPCRSWPHKSGEFAQQTPDKLPPAATRGLASLCQALFSSNAFLYVD